MKSIIRLTLIVLISFGAISYSARSETMYITDVLKISVREGNGPDYKIIGVIESGQEVEVISTNGDWAKVRLLNGREGWLNSKYLTAWKSGGTDLKKIKEKEALLNRQNTALKDELKNLSLQLAESRQALSETAKSLETLKDSSRNYVDLENKYNEAEKKLAFQKNKMDELEDENTKLSLQQNVVGAVILLVGFIIGYNARRDKSKSSLL
jgi:SH3 domain protein